MKPLPFLVMTFTLFLFLAPLTAAQPATTIEDIEAQRRVQAEIDRQRQAVAATTKNEDKQQEAQKIIEMLMNQLKNMQSPLTSANQQCTPFDPKCTCMKVWRCDNSGKCSCQPGPNMNTCPCYQRMENIGHMAQGTCVAQTNCKGASFSGLDGKTQSVGSASGFQQLLQGAMGLLQQMMQQQNQQNQQQQATQGTVGGCTAYYQVSTPTTDPCAYYIPPTSDSLLYGTSTAIDTSAYEQLLAALNGSSASDAALDASFGLSDESDSSAVGVSDQILNLTGSDAETQTTDTESQTPSGDLAGQAVQLQSGTRGDIQTIQGGVTVIASARDAKANTEVAGFYGESTFGQQPEGVVARLCRTRPWSDSIVSYVIPPSFFDSLCSWRGYQVGEPPPPAPPVVQQTITTTPPLPTPTTTPVSTVSPEVDIWAVPDRIPLGTRTSVFWNAKNVESCTVSSPDGNFEEHKLTGGAATVPLSGPTVFTISCIGLDGSHITDYVTVNMSI